MTEGTPDLLDEDAYSPAMTHWFGEPWPYPDLPAPVCADQRFHVDTPAGEKCLGCDEPIVDGESGVRMPMMVSVDPPRSGWAYYHAECNLRTVMCPYEMGLIPGAHEHDPAKRRDEARLLMRWAQGRVRSVD